MQKSHHMHSMSPNRHAAYDDTRGKPSRSWKRHRRTQWYRDSQPLSLVERMERAWRRSCKRLEAMLAPLGAKPELEVL